MIEFISRVLFIIPHLAIHTLFHHGSTVLRKIPEVSTLKKHDWDNLWEWLKTIYVYHLVPLYAPKKTIPPRHQPGAVQKLMDERVQEALLSEK